MPELPEIEAMRRYLISKISGEVITQVDIYNHTVIRYPSPNELKESLKTARLDQIRRVGKILHFSFVKHKVTSEQVHLYIDHGLTGRIRWGSSSKKFPKKSVFSIEFSNQNKLLYHDRRLHGAIWLYKSKLHEHLPIPEKIKKFGPDILEITYQEFKSRLKKFRGEIKGILTNQTFIIGIGNAYADEILFSANVHPFTKRNQLTEENIERIYSSSHKILLNATKIIFNILKETDILDNEKNWRSQIMAIHLKEGTPCPVCGSKISLIKAHRQTNFCRKCQISKNPNFI